MVQHNQTKQIPKGTEIIVLLFNILSVINPNKKQPHRENVLGKVPKHAKLHMCEREARVGGVESGW